MYRETPNEVIDYDWCLKHLMDQAEGRVIDIVADEQLVDQINGSHISDTPAGHLTKCQVAGCALLCLSYNQGGVLRIIDQQGHAVCEQ